jgi:hypothetical protein
MLLEIGLLVPLFLTRPQLLRWPFFSCRPIIEAFIGIGVFNTLKPPLCTGLSRLSLELHFCFYTEPLNRILHILSNVCLFAFIELLTTRTNPRQNVLTLRIFFCAYFSTWTRADHKRTVQVKCVVFMQRNGYSFKVRFR